MLSGNSETIKGNQGIGMIFKSFLESMGFIKREEEYLPAKIADIEKTTEKEEEYKAALTEVEIALEHQKKVANIISGDAKMLAQNAEEQLRALRGMLRRSIGA